MFFDVRIGPVMLLYLRVRIIFEYSTLSSTLMYFYRYGKAFEIESSLHSGINNVVLLIASGHEFDTSIELRKIGLFVCPSLTFTVLIVCLPVYGLLLLCNAF